jgi:hypothetical protein
MADYVEKFKASNPFNMEGFNAKIDQTNTAIEALGKAGFTLQKILDKQSLIVGQGVSLTIPAGTKMLIVTKQSASSIANIDTGNTFTLTNAVIVANAIRTNTYVFSIVGSLLTYYGYGETTWNTSSVTGESNTTSAVHDISVYAVL